MRIKMLGFFCLMTMLVSAGNYEVSSPNGKVKVTVNTDTAVQWSVDYNGQQVLLPSTINIRLLQGKKTIDLGTVGKVALHSVKSSFENPFYKRLTVSDEYGQLLLYTNQKFTIEVRAYNDGAAYRLISKEKKPAFVVDEMAEFCFAKDYPAFIPYVNDNRSGERYCYSFESYYDEAPLSKMYPDSLAISPLAICLPDGMKAIVMDAGLENYPGMFLKKGQSHSLKAAFAPYPLAQEVGGYDQLNLVPTKRADYIAKLNGEQALPWRAVVITERDADILNSDMSQRLAPACRIADLSWIQPGKVAWDWWNSCNITGVDFKSGMNTDTYLYYIDFAARNRIEYIIIDEGWSGKESLLEDLSPDIDLPRLIDYGNKRGVGIILWSSWRNLIGNNPLGGTATTEAVMKHYADMGIKGFKVDFFDRDDQQVIASAYQVAACAARHHLYLDLHGLKPFGIQRAYPNIFNFEGVKGLENSKWEPRVGDGPLHNQPRYDVTAPYLRMLAGPMDYTPGAMVNAMKDRFFGSNDHPMSQGTRVHQMAMYTTFEAPLQMLADSPTKYMQNQECTNFIAQIPTTFDETVALDGQLGEYTVIARRKGTTWYLAAMTDWTPRDLTIDLSFLGEGQFMADIFADGANAMKDAMDYKHTHQVVSNQDRLQIHLSSGGGWTAMFNVKSVDTSSVIETVPIKGNIIRPTDSRIQYTGRISFANPERPVWNYPGVQIIAAFEGTSLRMIAKPRSGYFVAQIDQAEPFKVAFRGERDSVVTLATALPDGVHRVKLMYAIEGYEFFPEFWGFVLDEGKKLVEAPALPSRKIEFIGNSITCGYGNEGLDKYDHFDYATENHYYSYASITARNLEAQHWVVARSGIGAYRNYAGPKTGNPESNMLAQYEYVGYTWNPDFRKRPTFLGEKWDFNRYQPDVVCINLGTNDLSTPNYDLKLLKQNYQKLLKMVRQHNPKAKIVFLTGTMLGPNESDIQQQVLNEVIAEAKKAGDKEVYRFDMEPISGDEFYGNDFHPNIYEDEKMAAELTAYLRSLMNWF